MIIWVLLFLATLIISFLLALRSMKNYRERPDFFKATYSTYLIQNPHHLTQDLLSSLHLDLLAKGWLLSLERLAKGSKRALIIYGPLEILDKYKSTLNLLELEDYTQKHFPNFECFEVSKKPGLDLNIELPFKLQDGDVLEGEQIWFQIVLQPLKGNSDHHLFSSTIRLLLHTQATPRLPILQHQTNMALSEIGLAVLPKAYPNNELVKFYRQRAMAGSVLNQELSQLKLNPKNILSLIGRD